MLATVTASVLIWKVFGLFPVCILWNLNDGLDSVHAGAVNGLRGPWMQLIAPGDTIVSMECHIQPMNTHKEYKPATFNAVKNNSIKNII